MSKRSLTNYGQSQSEQNFIHPFQLLSLSPITSLHLLSFYFFLYLHLLLGESPCFLLHPHPLHLHDCTLRS